MNLAVATADALKRDGIRRGSKEIANAFGKFPLPRYTVYPFAITIDKRNLPRFYKGRKPYRSPLHAQADIPPRIFRYFIRLADFDGLGDYKLPVP